jgi:hypothetical protein
VGTALNSLAELYRVQGRYGEAEPLYRRSLAVTEKALGPDHPDVGASLNNLAWLALARNDLAGAADRWRRSGAVVQRRAERGLGGALGGSSKGEAQRQGWVFAGLVKVTYRLAAEARGAAKEPAAEMFETAQWGVGSEAAGSLAQMAARSATGSPELAALVRERQDLVGEWQAKDKLLIAAKSAPPERRSAAGETALSDRLAAIDARLAAIDAGLARNFPGYAALASPKPVSVADVQASLRNNEALVLFLDTVEFKPLAEETFVWVVTKSEMRWLRSELGTAALKREVAALRCGLDARAWDGAGAQRCADLLKLPPGTVPKDGEPLPGKDRGEHIMSGTPPIFAEHQMGSCSRIPSCEDSPARKGSGSARLVIQLRDQKRLRVRRHGTARDDARPQLHRRSGDERWAQGHDLQIVVQVLALTAVECAAGHAPPALAVVADAAQVAPRRVGEEDVGSQVDGLRPPLEASPEAGERSKVDSGVDGDEHVGILRHGLVGGERAEQGNPQDTRRRPGRPHEREHGVEQVRPRVRHGGSGCRRRPAVAAACHEAVGPLHV